MTNERIHTEVLRRAKRSPFKKVAEKQKYDVRECSTCGDFTNHVEVDTVAGKVWQCEICGTYWEEEQE